MAYYDCKERSNNWIHYCLCYSQYWSSILCHVLVLGWSLCLPQHHLGLGGRDLWTDQREKGRFAGNCEHIRNVVSNLDCGESRISSANVTSNRADLCLSLVPLAKDRRTTIYDGNVGQCSSLVWSIGTGLDNEVYAGSGKSKNKTKQQ